MNYQLFQLSVFFVVCKAMIDISDDDDTGSAQVFVQEYSGAVAQRSC